MVAFALETGLISNQDRQLLVHNADKVVAYEKGIGTFVFNFDPNRSYDGYFVPTVSPGKYTVTFSTDDFCFGGQGRVYHQSYVASKQTDGRVGIRLYLPSRTAIVLKKEK